METLAKSEHAESRYRDLLSHFVDQALQCNLTVSREIKSTIEERIAQIDHLLSLQLNEILHNPKFQQMEATWRGIRHLIEQSETGAMLKIKLFNISKRDLLRELQCATEFDQSYMFKKVYEEEFAAFGGEPLGALLGDYYFGKGATDIELLERMSQIAAAAHAPFITAALPEVMNLESFTQLDASSDLNTVFDSADHALWNKFRLLDEACYVCFTMPRVMMRVPYGRATTRVDEFNYEEGITGLDHEEYLWGNAAYALAARITHAFAQYGWCAAIRGVEGGGLVEGLPVHVFTCENGDVSLKCPTETIITDRCEKELADLGFAPLVHCMCTDYAAFFSVPSAKEPKGNDENEASANARLSVQLPYILACSRFAHYLMAIMRDKAAGSANIEQCEVLLNNWLQQYVIENESASEDDKAKFPLREARLEIVGRLGALQAVAALRPHFQLEDLSVPMQLMINLPPSVKW